MATPILGQQAAAPHTSTDDLRISMWVDEFAVFEGTAAQLTAEGLIPAGFDWQMDKIGKSWEANGFRYWLLRTRPEGHKGTYSTWQRLDNWSLRVTVVAHERDPDWRSNRRLKRMADEMSAEQFRHSDAGYREWRANYRKFEAAGADKAFQAFKALVPGLIPPRRGRKPKAAQ